MAQIDLSLCSNSSTVNADTLVLDLRWPERDLSSLFRLLLREWHLVLASLTLFLTLAEQITYQWRRKHLPGPGLVLPFFGGVFDMIWDTAKFWRRQAGYGALSWNVLVGRYIVFIRESEASQKVFANVSPQGFNLIGHPFGKKIFGKDNMIMMQGERHKDLRRRLLPLFTVKALGVYISVQDQIVRRHLARWAKEASGKPIKLRGLVRDMNLETSQEVFAGPYLTPETRRSFTKDYALFNEAVMSLPIDLPGFAFYKGAKAVKRVVATLAQCAAVSKKAMRAGGEPQCLLDFWMKDIVQELDDCQAQGKPTPEHCSDFEIGQHLFDFLFAAQDASSSSLLWAAAQLDSHPEILAKIRAEQQRLRPDRKTPLTGDLLAEMRYTRQVMLEGLRFRPPAPLVPHIANTDFPLTEDYAVPKGTVVFPSLLEASFQGFPDPHVFDPDRFSPERREDVKYRRNWLLFGAGPHQCIGQRYAMNHIMLFIALLSTELNWERVRTPGCDDLAYQPTIYPKDGVLVKITERCSDERRLVPASA